MLWEWTEGAAGAAALGLRANPVPFGASQAHTPHTARFPRGRRRQPLRANASPKCHPPGPAETEESSRVASGSPGSQPGQLCRAARAPTSVHDAPMWTLHRPRGGQGDAAPSWGGKLGQRGGRVCPCAGLHAFAQDRNPSWAPGAQQQARSRWLNVQSSLSPNFHAITQRNPSSAVPGQTGMPARQRLGARRVTSPHSCSSRAGWGPRQPQRDSLIRVGRGGTAGRL